jgi:methionine biosynthesis protein MetW
MSSSLSAEAPPRAGAACPWCGAVLPSGAPRLPGRVVCPDCGVARTDPWPTDTELDAAYATSYRPESGRFSGPGDALLRRTRGRLARRLDEIAPPGPVLDVGCGDGALLAYLVNFKQVDARGMELSQAGVNACVASGLSVIQGDADTDLRAYPDDAFDYVILSQTLQATREPREVLRQMLRVGKRAIVSLPNFAHWQVRLRMVFGGRMPQTPSLPFKWYDTPNIHLCSIDDFRALCREMGVQVERAIVLDRYSQPIHLPPLLSNLMGEQAVFLLRRNE